MKNWIILSLALFVFIPAAQASLVFDGNFDTPLSSGVNGAIHTSDCHSGSCYDFDGIDDFIALDSNLLNSADDFTFAGWIYWEGPDNSWWQRIFDFGTPGITHFLGNYMFLTTVNEHTHTARFATTITNNNEEEILDSTNIFPLDEWTHVAVVLEGDIAKIYINGVVNSQTTVTLNPSDLGASNYWLGKSKFYDVDPYFKGKMDEVMIYDHALTSDEVNILFQPQQQIPEFGVIGGIAVLAGAGLIIHRRKK